MKKRGKPSLEEELARPSFVKIGVGFPEARQKEILEIIDRPSEEEAAQEFLKQAALVVALIRIVNAKRNSAEGKAKIRRDLKTLKKNAQRFIEDLNSFSRSGLSLLEIGFYQLKSAEQGHGIDRSTARLPSADSFESVVQRQLDGRAWATIASLLDNSRTLIKALDSVPANWPPSQGGRPRAQAPRFLRTELARLFRDVLKQEILSYADEEGPFARVYRACYAEARGYSANQPFDKDLRRHLRL